jgi:hypothetical protein
MKADSAGELITIHKATVSVEVTVGLQDACCECSLSPIMSRSMNRNTEYIQFLA